MALAILLVLLAGLVIGGFGIILAVDIARAAMEETPATRPAQANVAAKIVDEIPAFIGSKPLLPPTTHIAWAQDDFVNRLEAHLQAEQALVARFLLEPSIDSLYRQESASLQVH